MRLYYEHTVTSKKTFRSNHFVKFLRRLKNTMKLIWKYELDEAKTPNGHSLGRCTV